MRLDPKLSEITLFFGAGKRLTLQATRGDVTDSEILDVETPPRADVVDNPADLIDLVAAYAGEVDFTSNTGPPDSALLAGWLRAALRSADMDLLRGCRNAPYARHGLAFSSNVHGLRTMFEGRPWYQPITTNIEVVAAQLNEYESRNLRLIVAIEADTAKRGN
jgi:hypothetical protein